MCYKNISARAAYCRMHDMTAEQIRKAYQGTGATERDIRAIILFATRRSGR